MVAGKPWETWMWVLRAEQCGSHSLTLHVRSRENPTRTKERYALSEVLKLPQLSKYYPKPGTKRERFFRRRMSKMEIMGRTLRKLFQSCSLSLSLKMESDQILNSVLKMQSIELRRTFLIDRLDKDIFRNDT